MIMETMKVYPFAELGDRIGKIELLEWIGGDSRIIQRARKCYQSQDRATPEKDAKLMTQTAAGKPMHGTVFRGTVMTFDVVLPLFCMRQWVRHLAGHDYYGNDVWSIGTGDMDVAGAFDEMSLRYVDGRNVAFYIPHASRITNGKGQPDVALASWISAQKEMMARYEQLRDMGVPKELARSFIPQSVYTQMEYTVNVQAALDFAVKRAPGTGAQWEMQQYAAAVILLARQYVAPQAVAEFLKGNGIDMGV